MNHSIELIDLGWQAFFQQQLTLDEWDTRIPARIIEQHKSAIIACTQTSSITINLTHTMPEMVVGDWLLLDLDGEFVRLLERKTCFSRKAAGSKVKEQLISANVDTAFIMTSMNNDFNLNRIERFLALTNESGAQPVIILSKSDQTNDPYSYIDQVQALDPFLMVIAVNSLDANCTEKLKHWIKKGSTIAMLGSSGVGKSTLTNTLINSSADTATPANSALQSTGDIREDDSKGRHTTTRRSLVTLAQGGLILDTPGMREIQLADCKEGIASTFADIETLAENCKFQDCQHENEPKCAVQKALAAGDIDKRRLNNYKKLLREEAINGASIAQKREDDKSLGKFYKSTIKEALKLKGR
jgi:ribosome biogenesis GTPase